MKKALFAVLLGAAAAPLAHADAIVYSAADGKVINSQLTVGGTSYNVDWYLPAGQASGLMTFQHGFSRGCGNQRNTSLNIMRRNVMVLCMNASMQGGNPTLARQLAELLASRNVYTPDGRQAPVNVVVGGHSAGGHFATEVGKRLAEVGYPGLKGAMLFDPVAQGGFTDNLVAISNYGNRSVLAVTANGNACNLNNNAYGALKQIRQTAIHSGKSGFVGLQLTSGSTHVDSEGENTDILGWTACLNLKPKAANTQYLRDLSAAWVNDLMLGTRDTNAYPGGGYVTTLINAGRAKLIQ